MVLNFLCNHKFNKIVKSPFFLFFVIFELFYLKNNNLNTQFLFNSSNLCLCAITFLLALFLQENYINKSKFRLFCIYILIFLTFFNSLVEQTLFFIQSIQQYRVSYLQVFCGYFLLIILIFKKFSPQKLNYFLYNYFIISFFYFIISISVYIYDLKYDNNKTASKKIALIDKPQNKSNNNKSIIFLVLDEYSPDSELLSVDYINSKTKLELYLDSSNFKVKTVFTKEAATIRSINRIFNSRYHIDFSSSNISIIKKQLFNSDFLKEIYFKGYSFINLSFFDFKLHPSISPKNPYEVNSSFAEIIRFSIFKLFYDRLFENKKENFSYNKLVYEEAINLFQQEGNNTNKFIYIHLLMPHGPFYFGTEFEYKLRNVGNYIKFREFTNIKVVELLNCIDFNNYKVLIVSDHGYRSNRLINPYKVIFSSFGFTSNVDSINSLDQLHNLFFE